jgi:hypothetical protein
MMSLREVYVLLAGLFVAALLFAFFLAGPNIIRLHATLLLTSAAAGCYLHARGTHPKLSNVFLYLWPWYFLATVLAYLIQTWGKAL